MFFKITKTIMIACLCWELFACSTMKSSTDEKEEGNKKIATAKINTQLGMAYLEQHNIQRAKRKFLLALDQAPNIPETWYSMGYFLEVTGDKEQAQTYYLKSVSLAPGRGDVQNNYGTYLCRSGEYQSAIKHFELAAKDINYVDTSAAYENAGLCAIKIPDRKLALTYLKKAVEADPQRAGAYMNLALLSYQAKNYAQSRQYLSEFLSLTAPTDESDYLSSKLSSVN